MFKVTIVTLKLFGRIWRSQIVTSKRFQIGQPAKIRSTIKFSENIFKHDYAEKQRTTCPCLFVMY